MFKKDTPSKARPDALTTYEELKTGCPESSPRKPTDRRRELAPVTKLWQIIRTRLPPRQRFRAVFLQHNHFSATLIKLNAVLKTLSDDEVEMRRIKELFRQALSRDLSPDEQKYLGLSSVVVSINDLELVDPNADKSKRDLGERRLNADEPICRSKAKVQISQRKPMWDIER